MHLPVLVVSASLAGVAWIDALPDARDVRPA